MSQVADAGRSFVRVAHPSRSLWQSCVRQVVATHIAQGNINAASVAQHPLVQEADAGASRLHSSGAPAEPRPLETVQIHDSLFEIALAHAHDLVHRLGSFAESIGHFDNLNPLFIECVFEFLKYYWLPATQVPGLETIGAGIGVWHSRHSAVG